MGLSSISQYNRKLPLEDLPTDEKIAELLRSGAISPQEVPQAREMLEASGSEFHIDPTGPVQLSPGEEGGGIINSLKGGLRAGADMIGGGLQKAGQALGPAGYALGGLLPQPEQTSSSYGPAAEIPPTSSPFPPAPEEPPGFMGPPALPQDIPAPVSEQAGGAGVLGGAAGGLAPPPVEPAAEDNTDRNRMILSIMEGLTRAGAEASNVQSISAILAGQQRQPTESASADQLQRINEMMGERQSKALEKIQEAENPLVLAYNEKHGTKFESPDQVLQDQSMRGKEEAITTSKFARGATPEGQAAVEAKAGAATEKTKVESRKQLGDAVHRIRQSTGFKAQDTSLKATRLVLKVIESANPEAIRAAGIQMARAAGEVGNLSKTEQQQYQTLLGMWGKLTQAWEFFEGAQTEEHKARLAEVAQLYHDHADGELDGLLKRETKSYGDRYKGTSFELEEGLIKNQFEGLRPGKEEKKIWMVDPTGELPAQEIVESKRQIYIDAEWVDG